MRVAPLTVMKNMTKMFALGALGLLGVAGAVGVRALVRRHKMKAATNLDLDEFEEPLIVAEEVVVVTEEGPFGIEMELIPVDEIR